MKRVDIYGGRAPQAVGTYSVTDAASYLQLAPSTVRAWVLGRPYPTRAGRRTSAAIVRLDDEKAQLLSFRNLVEVHVLSALRQHHNIRLDDVRRAVQFLRRQFGTQHPLAEQEMFAAGRQLFVKHLGHLINVSSEGQFAMEQMLETYLSRVERDRAGVPVRLFPFASTGQTPRSSRVIVIDPTIRFGRPCIAGSGVPTSAVGDRYKAGESMDSLAKDFACTSEQIEEAVRYEFQARQAA